MTALLERRERRAAAPAAGRARRPSSPAVASARWALAGLSVLSLWVVFYALTIGGLREARSQAQGYARLRQRLAEATAPLGGAIAPGTPVAVLDAPRGGLHRLVVVEGTSPADLTRGPGHRADTPLPGQPGVAVVFGRAVTYGAPFHGVTRLRAGDRVTVTTGQGTFGYVVERVRHAGDPLPPPLAAGGGRLVLVTAEGGGRLGALAPDGAVYVDARLDGPAQPAPPGRPAFVQGSAQAMRGEPGVVIDLVLWLQALLLVAVGGVWAAARWGGRQTWLVTAPVLVAVLCAATESALRLLPNLV